MILRYLALCVCSFLLSLLLTPLVRRLAIINAALDYPDERKMHKEAVPRIGGIAMTISFLLPLLLSYILYPSEMLQSIKSLIGLSAGALVICIIGVWDDLLGMSARVKLVGQAVTALMLIPFGLIIRGLSFPFVTGFISIDWVLGIPLTVFWIAGIINTINFIDGMDGLAAGVTMTISIALFIISIITEQFFMAISCLILAGSILGFLRYNFNPASIFMGDCGAMFLGFILAAISIEVLFNNRSITAGSVASVLIFGYPIVDATWSIIRRLMKKKSPFHADSSHIHNRLTNLGLSQRKAVFIIYVANLLCIVSGLAVALVGIEALVAILPILMLSITLVSIILLNRASPAVEIPERERAKISRYSYRFTKKPPKEG